MIPFLRRRSYPFLRFAAACALASALAARADHWAPNLATTATWHQNASNADASADEISALALQVDLLSAQRYPLGRADALHLTAHLGGEWWPRFRGLTQGAVGGRAEWRHTFGPGPLAPTISIEGSADAIAARETGRRGVTTGVTFLARKRLDPRTRLSAWHEVSWLAARYSTYDRAASETALALDRELNESSRLTFSVRFRDGDIVTHATPPHADLAALALHQLDVDTFGRPMRAYRVDARTRSGRLAYTRALNEDAALVASAEWRTTARASLRFGNLLLALAIVHQY